MAKANSSSRSLIEISKTQGWDSNRIWDQDKGAYTGESLVPWNHPREPFDRTPMGPIPTGAPEVKGTKDPTGGPVMDEKITFNHPDVSREAKVSGKPKMTLSNPDPGDPGY